MTEQNESADTEAQTARTVGQLVKYSREVNQSRTVQEVGSYALEAAFHVMDGHPTPTVTEVGQGELRVLESMRQDQETGDAPGELCRRAYEADATAILTQDPAALHYRPEDSLVLAPGDLEADDVPPGQSIAAPSVHRDESSEVGVVLAAHWETTGSVEEYHVRPLEYLADHVATAIDNIRSRERLERAHQDLATRNEMLHLYDRILRHDLGNDLQVITGFSDTIARTAADDTIVEYAETIERTATSAADLIDRVGSLVRTLEQEAEPEPRPLEPILTDVVSDVTAKFDDLTVEYDANDADVTVYAGELLDTVFTNLLSNAAVHNEVPVEVRVTVDQTAPDRVAVVVADDGAGIDPAVRDDLFEMGQKGPESDGTGLGLGFVRALTESYGGDVTVRESDRGGAEFHVELERV